MKLFDWDEVKNMKLLMERGICFEDIVLAIEEGKLLDVVRHKNLRQYPEQMLIIVEFKDYAYLVPFIEDKGKIYLKTIIPNRQATKKYLINKKEK